MKVTRSSLGYFFSDFHGLKCTSKWGFTYPQLMFEAFYCQWHAPRKAFSRPLCRGVEQPNRPFASIHQAQHWEKPLLPHEVVQRRPLHPRRSPRSPPALWASPTLAGRDKKPAGCRWYGTFIWNLMGISLEYDGTSIHFDKSRIWVPNSSRIG